MREDDLGGRGLQHYDLHQILQYGKATNGVEVQYDYYHACLNGSSCCDGDYCRCGVIKNLKVVGLHRGVDLVRPDAPLTPIELYAVRGIVWHHVNNHTKSNLHTMVVDGYYGEEVGASRFVPSLVLEDKLRATLGGSDQDLILSSLLEEHNHLLPCVTGLTTWEIRDVPVAKLGHNQNHLESASNTFAPKRSPLGLAVECDGGFRLIDGYHRVKGWMMSNRLSTLSRSEKTISLVVGSK